MKLDLKGLFLLEFVLALETRDGSNYPGKLAHLKRETAKIHISLSRNEENNSYYH